MPRPLLERSGSCEEEDDDDDDERSGSCEEENDDDDDERSGSCEEEDDDDDDDNDHASAAGKGAAEDHNLSSVCVAISAAAARAGAEEAADVAEVLTDGEAGTDPEASRDDEHAGCGEAGAEALHIDGRVGRGEVELCEACPAGCLLKQQPSSRPL